MALLSIMLCSRHSLRANDQFHQTLESWQGGVDTTEEAFSWIAANTPNGTIAIAPPWRQDLLVETKRAQVAAGISLPIRTLPNGIAASQALAGEMPRTKDGDTRTEFYYSLPKERSTRIASEHRCRVFRERTQTYPYRSAFSQRRHTCLQAALNCPAVLYRINYDRGRQ